MHIICAETHSNQKTRTNIPIYVTTHYIFGTLFAIIKVEVDKIFQK